ncbi:LOW QUALITY PROTEIN: checkpoint protein HUS1B [Molossus nigricans]
MALDWNFVLIIGTISKVANVCVLLVYQDKLCFGTLIPESCRRPGCKVRWGDFFHWFLKEGVSEEFKEIYLELAPGHLFRAVRKKHRGCLCPKALANQQASSQPHGGCGAALAHSCDLPGRVLSNGVLDDFPEPRDQACDVIYLPALKTKSSVEKMANMGDQVLVEANLNGKMNSSIETDIVTIKSYLSNLGNPPVPAQDIPQNRNLESMVLQVWVENRKLLQFLRDSKLALCNILSNSLLHLLMSFFSISFLPHKNSTSLFFCLFLS